MTQNGIKITDLRAEVQTLVNSDPTKYDPNKNGKIDDGDELSQLLSEYQCKKEDLTSNDGDKMWTLNEQLAANDYAKTKEEDGSWLFPIFGGIAALGTLIGTSIAADDNCQVEKEIRTKRFVDTEKLVADGSYNTGGRPAYDISNKMKHYISEDAAKRMQSDLPRTAFRKNIVDLVGCSGSSYFTRDAQGKPFVLRDWKPGDPQFVKTGTEVVEDVKKVKVFNKKLMTKGGIIAAGLALGGFAFKGIYDAITRSSAKNEAFTKIKAQQTADGERIFEQRRKEEAELKARKEAMRKEELEYKERLDAATSGIENNISSADRKAKSVNKELDKIKEKVTTEE